MIKKKFSFTIFSYQLRVDKGHKQRIGIAAR